MPYVGVAWIVNNGLAVGVASIGMGVALIGLGAGGIADNHLAKHLALIGLGGAVIGVGVTKIIDNDLGPWGWVDRRWGRSDRSVSERPVAFCERRRGQQ